MVRFQLRTRPANLLEAWDAEQSNRRNVHLVDSAIS